jgi:hypothetical protein
MSLINQIRSQVRRLPDDQIKEIKVIIEGEYNRRIRAELNSERMRGAS